MQSVAKQPKKKDLVLSGFSDDQFHGNGHVRYHTGLQILDQVLCQQLSCQWDVLADGR